MAGSRVRSSWAYGHSLHIPLHVSRVLEPLKKYLHRTHMNRSVTFCLPVNVGKRGLQLDQVQGQAGGRGGGRFTDAHTPSPLCSGSSRKSWSSSAPKSRWVLQGVITFDTVEVR